VAVLAWPIRALIERGKTQDAEELILLALETAETMEHRVNKMDALDLVWQASWPIEGAMRKTVLDALLAACHDANSWKSGRIMSHVALVVAANNKIHAQQIVDSMRVGIHRRRSQRKLDAGETQDVRPFFW